MYAKKANVINARMMSLFRRRGEREERTTEEDACETLLHLLSIEDDCVKDGSRPPSANLFSCPTVRLN